MSSNQQHSITPEVRKADKLKEVNRASINGTIRPLKTLLNKSFCLGTTVNLSFAGSQSVLYNDQQP